MSFNTVQKHGCETLYLFIILRQESCCAQDELQIAHIPVTQAMIQTKAMGQAGLESGIYFCTESRVIYIIQRR